ncbi:MAG: hypothetical protein CR217_14620 [Beijerinckiaceae bacterium]|nr:MAG: hypothetical protein CR217_14620 [Beijerinckiaceae bacterium]
MPGERRHDESIHAFSVPRPNGLEKRVVFLLSNFAIPLKKRKSEKSIPRALLSRRLAQNAYRAGRQTGRRALSASGKDNGPAPRQ